MQEKISLATGIPLAQSPFFPKYFNEYADLKILKIANELHNNGFAIIDFPERNIFNLADNITDELYHLYDWDGYKRGDANDMRIQDAWKANKHVKACRNELQITLHKF